MSALSWSQIADEKKNETFICYSASIFLDLIVQLVDARRPLLYRCGDVEKYVTEVGARQGPEQDRKTNLLLVNKADLVSEEQRKQWAEYFNTCGIDFVFFSAVEEQEKIDELKEAENLEEIAEENGMAII